MLYSEFDTNLLTLTTIPVIGFFKLLPTFGGCVITASTAKLVDGKIEMEVACPSPEHTSPSPSPKPQPQAQTHACPPASPRAEPLARLSTRRRAPCPA